MKKILAAHYPRSSLSLCPCKSRYAFVWKRCGRGCAQGLWL